MTTDEPFRVLLDPATKALVFQCDHCDPESWGPFDTLDDAEDAMVDHQLDVHHAGEVKTA